MDDKSFELRVTEAGEALSEEFGTPPRRPRPRSAELKRRSAKLVKSSSKPRSRLGPRQAV